MPLGVTTGSAAIVAQGVPTTSLRVQQRTRAIRKRTAHTFAAIATSTGLPLDASIGYAASVAWGVPATPPGVRRMIGATVATVQLSAATTAFALRAATGALVMGKMLPGGPRATAR
mmetsp:Transcript_50988/g.147999  ORF Transcript_50988/g.147999 Transcript_50988/m.147999 type:complete len:116 (+) Transcript_50988:169-516(+)